MSRRRRHTPRFVTGSILRHVTTMAGTGAIGLVAIFSVDLLNYFYISSLKDPTLTASIAFASCLGFVLSSMSIGISIGLGATCGRLLGARKRIQARRTASSCLLVTLVVSTVLGLLTAVFAPTLYLLVGTPGPALASTVSYLRISAPAFPLICLGMALSGLLRANGAARSSMLVTLSGAACTAIMDPVLIFGFHLGLQGAALTSVFARSTLVLCAYLSLRPYNMVTIPRFRDIYPSIKDVGQIALPAMITNIATPIGGLYVTHSMAKWGLEAVSAQAAIDRSVPIAFSFVFALTGSVGPIMAQNLGALYIDRVRETFIWSLKLAVLCIAITWAIFFFSQDIFIKVFSIQGIGIPMVKMFCDILVVAYVFLGLLFVSNTAFNNLGHPLYSTFFNWGRATLGTIPFVYFGSRWNGPIGIMEGFALGAVVFGTLALIRAVLVINQLEAKYNPVPTDPDVSRETVTD